MVAKSAISCFSPRDTRAGVTSQRRACSELKMGIEMIDLNGRKTSAI
jgi:hypothetical protein